LGGLAFALLYRAPTGQGDQQYESGKLGSTSGGG
jgi:hypothetical protein